MKWFPLTAGAIVTLVGIYLFVNPAVVTATIAWLFALVMFVSGISTLIAYFSGERGHLLQLIQAVISIIFGFILLSSSTWALSNVAVTILAYWLLISAIVQFSHAYRLRQTGFSGNSQLSTALVALVFALLLFSAPFFSAAVIGRFVAVLVIISGISTLSFFFRI
ncbi:DUF308 domain-containing protein [Streptococcus loxodontisalivarius]|uniref:Uncharacterized membrane protein HdeD (DUF308 family) n=1 Tax=Streptococcus loxodontisalivarius TaxID=1349415 RepID=A0ABS2PS69_9STRE|nr:DUF308 domain-containing protein [Streptococcus loxodontisalivarius]MBM7642887.1 uncharacterized membrane protein HdeD (DUF308 family) [Streptococcus loxodontisalivarius]